MTIITLISTVLNEKDSIESYIQSLLNQSILPDEIIIVDGGSTDGTFEILKKYEKKYPSLITVYRLDGANIAKGRNFAIRNSKGWIIVTSDAGCKYENDYVKKMIKPLLKFLLNNYKKFKMKKQDILSYIKEKGISIKELENVPEAEFVQGRYYPHHINNISYFASFFLVKQDQCKIPSRASARATAYFKYVWEDVGGYPEDFVTGEDTKFNYKVLERGFKWICVDTKVWWEMPRNLKEFYTKFERYAIGDTIQGNLIKNKKLLLFFLSYWIFIAILLLSAFIHPLMFYRMVFIIVFFMIMLSIYGLIRTKRLSSLLLYPLLLLLRYTAYVIGIIKGIIRRWQ